MANGIVVYPRRGVNPETLAKRITHDPTLTDLTATGPQAFQDQIAASTGTFTAIIYGIALISLLVGGLSVINTMTMSVSERTREIGMRKAIGAIRRAGHGPVRRRVGGDRAVSADRRALARAARRGGGNAAGAASGQALFLRHDAAHGRVRRCSRWCSAWSAACIRRGMRRGLNPVEALRYE